MSIGGKKRDTYQVQVKSGNQSPSSIQSGFRTNQTRSFPRVQPRNVYENCSGSRQKATYLQIALLWLAHYTASTIMWWKDHTEQRIWFQKVDLRQTSENKWTMPTYSIAPKRTLNKCKQTSTVEMYSSRWYKFVYQSEIHKKGINSDLEKPFFCLIISNKKVYKHMRCSVQYNASPSFPSLPSPSPPFPELQLQTIEK